MTKEKINSLAIALLLCANPISWVLSFLPNAIVFVALIAWGIIMLNGQLLKVFKAPFYVHIFSLCTLLFFIFSYNINFTASVVEYFTFFLVFGVTGAYFATLKFDVKDLFYFIAVISSFLVLFINNLDFGDPSIESVDYGMWMGVSYGSLRLLLSLIIILFIYRREYSKIIMFIFFASLILYILIFVNYASRGAIVGVIIFVYGIVLSLGKPSLKKKIFTTSVALFAIILMLNFELVINSLVSTLHSFGIQINALDKIQLLAISGNIDNGRNELIRKGLDGFYDSPVFGNGIAGFEQMYGTGYYVHNFIIQILYEGGFLFFFPILIVLIGSIKILFMRRVADHEKVLVLFLICAGIIELLFSNVYWRSVFFWFFIIYTIRLLSKCKSHRYYE